MTDMSTEQFEAATARGRKRLAGPRAESAHYDRERDRIVVRLETGVEISFAPRTAQGLQDASATDLDIIEVEAFGLGIHFPRLDADIYVPSLVQGVAGSKRWMAGQRAAAAQGENERRAGRPRKTASSA